jgi:DNA-binding IclR family transcriptional regulator
LEAFGTHGDHLALSEITRRSRVAKASVHRLAQEPIQWGVVERRGSDYCLGMRLFEIGLRVPPQRILREMAHPYIGRHGDHRSDPPAGAEGSDIGLDGGRRAGR